MGQKVKNFYAQYHGHDVSKLERVHSRLRGSDGSSPRPCVFLAGDSSLDNKYWLEDTAEALNGYEEVLSPPTMKKDVAYFLNKQAVEKGERWFALNCAVEESALCDRWPDRLLPQDKFIRDHITENDVLIVSVGGNDVAFKVTPRTAANMALLAHATTVAWVEKAMTCSCNKWSCTTCVFRAPGLSYFVSLFKNKVEKFVSRLIEVRKPRLVIVCMIYNPNEDRSQPSWANLALGALNYNSFPQKLQTVIKVVYEMGTSQIRLEGTKVMGFPLFRVLDGKTTEDYVERVEPSVQGGEKMGKAFYESLQNAWSDSSD